MIRKALFNGLFMGILLWTIHLGGIDVNQWQYWIAFFCSLGSMINSMIDSDG